MPVNAVARSAAKENMTMAKKSKTVPTNPNATDSARAKALERLVAPAANGSPTTPAVANDGVVGAVAGSPVPRKAKAAKIKVVIPAKEAKPTKLSGLDAAALVLSESKEPMNMKQVFAEIMTRKLWATKGATPEATLYAAVIREIAAKGKDSRFRKHDRGLFTASK
jgi:hypothetical protein